MGPYNPLTMNTPMIDIVTELALNDDKHIQDRIGRSSKISAHCSLQWQSDYATHIDSQYIDNLNVWRDFFPAEMESQLDGCCPGDIIGHSYSAGEALPEFSTSQRPHR